jgi:ethanolamine ammonia-lyase small subunit
MNNPNIVKNDWEILNKLTTARIGLGRTGVSLPTDRLLDFQLAHAKAQDAVYLPLDIGKLDKQLKSIEMSYIDLHSQANSRETYLQRPDLGRKLDKKSSKKLIINDTRYDLAIVIVDGLSSLAIHENAVNFLKKLTNVLHQDSQDWSLAPLTIVKQGRVAIGDEIGERLNANTVLVLIGERPGLSSPDSLGLYMTWEPKVGLKDSNRNCISNIRSKGLSYEEAAKKAFYLLVKSRELKFSGVELKERSSDEIPSIKSLL